MKNLAQRLIVAALGIPILLYAAVRGHWPLIVVLAAIQAVILWEWKKLHASRGAIIWIPGAALSVFGLDYLVFTRGQPAAVGIAIGLVFLAMLGEVFRRDHQPLKNLGALALFLVYVVLPLALWMVLNDSVAASRLRPAGPLALLFVATWICDTGAYFGGRQFGRHKLYVAASPNKTVEGFVAGLMVAFVILPLASLLQLATPSLADYIVLPLIVGIAGQLGDLLESLMKREIQVKDTSSVLPGHGGFLDRFDSLLISSPLLFAYLALSPP